MQELKAHTQTVQSIAFANDGAIFASGGDDRRICIWDSFSGDRLGMFPRVHRAGIRHLSISQDGKLLCSTASDQSARLWDVAASSERAVLVQNQSAHVFSSAFSRDGKFLAVCRSSSVSEQIIEHAEIRVWRIPDKIAIIAHLPHFAAHLAFSPNGKWLVSGGGKDLSLWSIGSFSRRESASLRLPVGALAFSGVDNRLAVATSREASIWSVDPFAMQLPLGRAAKALTSLAYTPDGRTLAVGGNDGIVTLWDTTSGHVRLSLRCLDDGQVRCVGVSPDGLTMVVGGQKGLLRRFDLE